MASTYLTRTPSSAGSATKWTLSMWVKRSKLGVQTPIISTVQSSPSNTYDEMYFNTSDKFQFSSVYNNSQKAIRTTRAFRDTSAWYHIVFIYDTTNSTVTDHAQLWINGVRETSFEDTTLLASGANDWESSWNKANNPMRIGYQSTNTASYFDGSMAVAEFVNNQVYVPTYFGSTNTATGIWTPEASSTISDYGTNGYKLKMDTTSPGADTSGKSNTFTASGTPTLTQGNPQNNYATLNPLFAGDANITYSNGNLKTTATNESQKNAVGTIGVSSGKWYCEMVSRNGTNYPGFGIMDSQSVLQTSISYLGSSSDSYCMFQDGNYYTNGSASNTGTTWGVGSIMGLSIDLDSSTKTIKFYKNGSQTHSATIATPVNDYVFAVSHNTNGTITEINFGEGFFGTVAAGTNADGNGQGLFAYAVPSGYYAMNTKNLEAYG